MQATAHPSAGSRRSADRPRDPVVSFDDVAVAIGGTVLLPPVSAVAHPGCALAVTGGNGTGNTTLLTLLYGLASPTTGVVHVEGRIPDERPPAFRRAVAGMIGLLPFACDLTVREQLRLVALSWGAPSAGSGTPGLLADEWRERVGIPQVVYNRRRLHSSLGMVPPVEFEQTLSSVGVEEVEIPLTRAA